MWFGDVESCALRKIYNIFMLFIGSALNVCSAFYPQLFKPRGVFWKSNNKPEIFPLKSVWGSDDLISKM